ncbi:MAG: alpha/beta hydrolase, partial [Sphingomicrobium sp.]
AMLDVSAHVGELLVPLIGAVGERAALVGYCLGGTMAIAAANVLPVERVATLAAPWHFSRYPDEARAALQAMWRESRPAARGFGALPMEVLQAAFWSLVPARTVAKFAEFAGLERGGAKARRFAALEDWANEGEALPFPAARELIEDLFGADLPGLGRWTIGGRRIAEALDVPLLHLTAANDRIAPAATAPVGAARDIAAGHVGMVVGSARLVLHAHLAEFLRS